MAEEWTIRVCPCGHPLGSGMVADQIKACPECGRPSEEAVAVTVRKAPSWGGYGEWGG